MRKRPPLEEQGSLFDLGGGQATRRGDDDGDAARDERWTMPAAGGSTVAEIRLRWSKRLTPAQVAKVEAELNRLPLLLSKLKFGAVEVERAFVRRRKG